MCVCVVTPIQEKEIPNAHPRMNRVLCTLLTATEREKVDLRRPGLLPPTRPPHSGNCLQARAQGAEHFRRLHSGQPSRSRGIGTFLLLLNTHSRIAGPQNTRFSSPIRERLTCLRTRPLVLGTIHHKPCGSHTPFSPLGSRVPQFPTGVHSPPVHFRKETGRKERYPRRATQHP